MTQGMDVPGTFNPRRFLSAPECAVYRLCFQTIPVPGHEKRLTVMVKAPIAVIEICFNGLQCRLTNGHQALFAAFAVTDEYLASGRVNVVNIQTNELIQPHAGRIEQLDDGPVS